MAKDVRAMLNDLNAGIVRFGEARPEAVGAFSDFTHAAEKDGALDKKTKELIGVAISVYSRCEYCIVYHVYNALRLGAAREEILDAAAAAMIYGGGPAMAYASTMLLDCLDEFEKDFR